MQADTIRPYGIVPLTTVSNKLQSHNHRTVEADSPYKKGIH